MNTNATAPDTTARHPIRVVAARTGLTPTLLRAWERRYDVVDPGRSDGGQRLYSDADVERLLLLKQATDGGRAIRHVAEMSVAELRELVAEDRRAVRRAGTVYAAPAGGGAGAVLAEGLAAVEALDGEGLEAVLRRAVVALGAPAFVDEVVAPLLREIGDRWSRGELRPAHEHVATAVVERVLGWMIEPPRTAATGPVAVVGTLTGEEHSLGALLAAAAATFEGWRVTYMGGDLPPEELALAADQLGARVLGVSVVNPPDFDGISGQLRDLVSRLGDDVTLVLGGPSAEHFAGEVAHERLRPVGSMQDFRAVLRELAG